LGERLEKLEERLEQGLLHGLDFLKELLTLATSTRPNSGSIPWTSKQRQKRR
jgi:hypothetical protein